MMRFFLLCLALVVVTLPACTLIGPDDEHALDGRIRVTADEGEIVIYNGSIERIYYLAFPRSILPFILWGSHLDKDLSVARGERVRLSYAEVLRHWEDDEVVVYWWRAEVRDGERVPTEPVATVVQL